MEWGEYMQSLNETKAGESYTIKWMTGMPETMEQIRQYDVSEGKTVQIISRILGGVIVGVCGRRILISDDAACRIKVIKYEKRRKDNSFGEGIVLSGCFREDVMIVWEQKSNFFQK